MPPHPLTNFEIQKYYQNEPKFNGIFSRNNLSKIDLMCGSNLILIYLMCGYFCTGFIDFMLKGKKFIRVYKFIFS